MLGTQIHETAVLFATAGSPNRPIYATASVTARGPVQVLSGA